MPRHSEVIDITRILAEVRAGSKESADLLAESVYDDLVRIASNFFSQERRDHTLQPTALVHEAYMRIFCGAKVEWKDRSHFFAVAASQMRRVLVDHGRQFRAIKRGCGLKVSLDEARHSCQPRNSEFGELNQLLDRLEKTDRQAARVVELKFFAGMTDDEVAMEMGCGHSTVRRHWKFAKSWLATRISARVVAERGRYS